MKALSFVTLGILVILALAGGFLMVSSLGGTCDGVFLNLSAVRHQKT
jgi:hypothetical protein